MAEVTSQDFQKLLEEQQRTNQLLIEGNKDPSLASSIKQNLGEILNASRLAGQSEKFQEREGITDTDDITEDVRISQDKTTEILSTNALQSFANDMSMQSILLKTYRLLEAQFGSTENMRKILNSNTISASEQVEQNKDDNAANKKNKETLDEIKKNTGQTSGFLQFLSNAIPTASSLGKIIGTIFSLVGLFALFKFLSSPTLVKVGELLDKIPFDKAVGALKDIGNFFLTIVDNMIDNITDPDATTMQKIVNAVGLLTVATIGVFSKTIVKSVGALGLRALLGFAGLTLGAIFTPIGAFVVAALGAFLVKDEATRRAKEIIKQEGIEGDTMEKIKTYAATFLGEMGNGINRFFGAVIGIFDEETGKKVAEKDMVPVFNSFFKDTLPRMFDRLLMGIMTLLDSITFGAFLPDVEDFDAELQKLKDKKKAAMAMEFTTREDLDAIDEEIKQLEFDKRRVDLFNRRKKDMREMTEAEKAGLTGRDGATPDILAFKGGKIGQGQVGLVGELGPELIIPRTDAQVFSARRTEEMIMSALARGMGGGDGGGGDVITQIDGRVNNSSSILTVNNNRVTNPNSTLNAIAMST